MKVNHFDLSSVESALGLSSVVDTAQNAQTSINNLTPITDFLSQHWLGVVIGLFVAMVIADILAQKLTH